jgi:hypothetical protein
MILYQEVLLTTVRRCPQICSNASCFALGTDLRGIRRIVFFLAMALLALSPPPGAEVEAQPRLTEKCNPHLWCKTALTIALLRAAKRPSTWRNRPERRLRARIQCPWQRPQLRAPPFSSVRKTHLEKNIPARICRLE